MHRPFDLLIQTAQPLRGSIAIPGDKSISHRILFLGALAQGKTTVSNWLASGDTNASLRSIRDLGIKVEQLANGSLQISGGELQLPVAPLNLRHAGTGIRLLAGILAGQKFPSILDGSEQLRRRPMSRIVEPLRQMNAKIHAIKGCAPLLIEPSQLRGIEYRMPIASAQVKSAVLLAGLFAEGATTIIEPGPSRDHSELMLREMGADITVEDDKVVLVPGTPLRAMDITIPGDFSSAAFAIVAATLVPDSEVLLHNVNINPRRLGLLDVLREMGADIAIVETDGSKMRDPFADIRIRYSPLRGTEISGETVVRMIDEFPALMVAALHAQGETVVRDARELRVKETDRLATMTRELGKMGAQIEESEDGFRICGPQRLTAATVDSHDDHRIAMSLTIAGFLATGTSRICEAQCYEDSFPRFAQAMMQLGAEISIENRGD